MNPYDKEQVDAVWQRVTATSKPDNEGTDTTGVDLMELMNAECADRSLFLLLARMAGGCDGTLLRQIARDEGCHIRRLGALYYIQTGRKYCPMQAAMPCVACLNDALREAYQEKIRNAARYQRAAAQYPDQKLLFEGMADEEVAHSRMILCVLEKRL